METIKIINRLNIREATFYRKQNEAIDLLANLLYAEESPLRQERRAALELRLELSTYERLFGVDASLEQLCTLLETADAPWLVLLQGIGGIGKTALADALMRRAIDRGYFADFGWVTARPQRFRLDGAIVPLAHALSTPATLLEALATQLLDEPLPSPFSVQKVQALLKQRLAAQPHLLVVDNLETLSDLTELLPMLRTLANPSKILLTSREHVVDDGFIYPYTIPPLSEEDALALVRHDATTRHLTELAAAPDSALRAIYATVGGNPLALRLVVGQTYRHALDTVLEDLRMARGRSVAQLYTYIYRRSWDALNEDEQELFLSMPLVPEEGAGLAFLAVASGLSMTPLHDALETLLSLNLVDHRSGLHESRYTIHSLTRTFLLEQVIQWQM